MIAPEGYPLVAGAAVVAALLVWLGFQFGPVVQVICFAVAAFALVFTLYFFRDPARTPPADTSQLLLAPADGKIVQILDLDHEPLYLDGPARQVSIFLSPLNVHVNRVPADGVVEYVNYVPGDYLVAWHPKASEKNERSEIGMRHRSGTAVLFKQIAGAVARRIVYYLEEGEKVEAGARFGIVKFGSRMDVIVPPSVPLDVAVGDRVTAGETILGRLPAATGGAPADTLRQDAAL